MFYPYFISKYLSMFFNIFWYIHIHKIKLSMSISKPTFSSLLKNLHWVSEIKLVTRGNWVNRIEIEIDGYLGSICKTLTWCGIEINGMFDLFDPTYIFKLILIFFGNEIFSLTTKLVKRHVKIYHLTFDFFFLDFIRDKNNIQNFLIKMICER